MWQGEKISKELNDSASLVVQWLRIGLPVQGTQVQSQVQEDPTCRGAISPCAMRALEPVLRHERGQHNEKPLLPATRESLSAAKSNLINAIMKKK